MPKQRTPEEDRVYRKGLRARQRGVPPVPDAPVSRVIKTAADAEREVGKARTFTGEAHYFDGWVDEMSPGQRDYVYARLAAHATPRR